MLFSVAPGNAGTVLRIGHSSFLPNHFQFILTFDAIKSRSGVRKLGPVDLTPPVTAFYLANGDKKYSSVIISNSHKDYIKFHGT
jgi:hypothetical protein